MKMLEFVIFMIFAGTILMSALVAVFAKNIVYSVLGAVVSFLSVAGIFFILNADFLGVAQIFVYGVGVSILLAFAIMLTPKEQQKNLYLSNAFRVGLGFLSILALFVCINCFIIRDISKNGAFETNPPTVSQIVLLKNSGTTRIIGKRLLCDYVLPFELLSILLLVGIIGAGYLAFKEKTNV